jgi:hypothetical protein
VSKVRMILLWIAVVFLSCTLTATWTFAKGKGKGQGDTSPSGWSQGEKKGWKTDVPAGLEDKDKAGDPSGLTQEKKVQKENEDAEKFQEKEQKRSMEKERSRKKNREQKQKKE